MSHPEFIISRFNSDRPIDEVIRITKEQVKATLAAYKFIDKDTKQIVITIPSIEVSGYGETYEKAEEMAQFSIADYFAFLLSLGRDEIKTELAQCGWKQRLFHNKEFSKVSVDANGDLQNFNAEEGSIEKLSLVA